MLMDQAYISAVNQYISTVIYLIIKLSSIGYSFPGNRTRGIKIIIKAIRWGEINVYWNLAPSMAQPKGETFGNECIKFYI